MSDAHQFGTTSTGKPSSKLKNGRNWRKYLKIQTVADLESKLYSDAEIAFFLNVTIQYVRLLKNTPEFISARLTASTGMLSEVAKKSLESLEERRTAIEDMVPEALLAIRDTLLNNSNPALRLKAAQDLLDREGSLAKVSKTQIDLPTSFNYEEHERTANDLLGALQQIGMKQQKSLEEIQKEEEKEENFSVIKEFTQTSLDSDAQKKMQEAMELINSVKIDSTQTIN